MGMIGIVHGVQERTQLAQMVEKLFLYQDRQCNDKKTVAFVDEICGWGYPLEACLEGLRSLLDLDLKAIKMAHIRSAIEDNLPKTSPVIHICGHCDSTGTVPMVRDDGSGTVFACRCSKGFSISSAMGMQQWNGLNEQSYKGKRYTMRFPMGGK